MLGIIPFTMLQKLFGFDVLLNFVSPYDIFYMQGIQIVICASNPFPIHEQQRNKYPNSMERNKISSVEQIE